MSVGIVNYSAGKDSTAMLLKLMEDNQKIDDIIYVDVGDWMWDFVKDIIKQVEEYTGYNITVIDMSKKIKEGFNRWGFPSFKIRWCTGVKREAIRTYIRDNYLGEDIIQYVGYTADETRRHNRNKDVKGLVFPLVEKKISNRGALKICYDHGFYFNGIYSWHSHLNCWCCPFQKMKELEYIYHNFPHLFQKLKIMQKQVDGYFTKGLTVYDIERKFEGQTRFLVDDISL